MDSLESKSLGAVDWVFFSLLIVVSLGIGVHSALKGRGNSSTQEYLLGGRQMNPTPVAISLLGGVISAISILGLPTEMYFFGTQLVLNLVGCIFGVFIIQLLILPILYPLKITSVNEYIVMRFGSVRFRKFATVCSLTTSFIYMGICLYAPSLTLATVTNLSTFSSIAIMGSICTFYITIGGVKAVVYTDVIQTMFMFGGVLVVVVICCIDLGGVGNVFRVANEGSRLEFFNMDTSPLVRHTFWSVQVQGIYSMLAWIGLNQSTYQRFASVRTLTLSKRLCTFFLFGLYVLWLIFFFSGIVAYATYSNCDPLTSGKIEKPDQILPYLVLDKLSHLTGLSGLFVAAVYGGVLSSVSTTGNSVACLLWEDLLKNLKIFKDISDANATRIIKFVSAMAGLLGIGLGMLAGQLGSIIQVSMSISNAFSGSLTGIFISGMCAPWVNLKGAFSGYTIGLIFNLWLIVGKLYKGLGSPKKLPLSIAGCPEKLSNSTWSDSMNSTLLSTISGVSVNSIIGDNAFDSFNDSMPFTTPSPGVLVEEEEVEKDFYDLSYCYTGMLGIIINVVISTIVSIFTGPVDPDEVDARLVSPRCLRLYKRIWEKLMPSKGKEISRNDMHIDEKAAFPMIITRNSDHINTPE